MLKPTSPFGFHQLRTVERVDMKTIPLSDLLKALL